MSFVVRYRILSSAILVAILLGGCALGNRGRELSSMHLRFTRVMDIQTGVVLGDLGRANEAAQWLTQQEEDRSFPTRSAEYQTEMRRTAALIAEEDDLQSIAIQAGSLAATCGSCHQAMGDGPRFVVGSQPAEGESTPAHMIRHLWAVDRMWEGLVGPSEEAWAAGTSELSLGWEATEEMIFRSGSPERARNFLDRLIRLGSSAEDASTQKDRGALYGAVLRTCDGCHSS